MQTQQNFVLKCGGSTLAELPAAFFEELKQLQAEGIMPIIVHGGGPAISAMLSKLEIETEFVNGLRKTSEQVLDVVEMVLAGQINKQIVRKITSAGGKAIGLSGTDGGLLEAQPAGSIDEIGYVGEVVRVNTDLLHMLTSNGYLPVISPIGQDENGQRYNINADTAAGAVASAVKSSSLIVITDVPGIMKTVNQERVILPRVTVQQIEEMIASGEIYGGMIPKVKAAIDCIQGDVQEVVILGGNEPNGMTRVLNGEEVGTRIVKSSSVSA